MIYLPGDVICVNDTGRPSYAIINSILPNLSREYNHNTYEIKFLDRHHNDLWIDYGNNFRYATDGEIEFLNKKYKLNIPLSVDITKW